MAMVKLTLSANADLIADAKVVATRRKTSLSAMVSEFLRSVSRPEGHASSALGPITRRASGIVRLPPGCSDKDLLADALAARHGDA